MTTKEKAQAIYHKLLKDYRFKSLHNHPTTKLPKLIINLSYDYDYGIAIYTVDDWLDDFSSCGVDIVPLILIAQQSKDLDINDEYIRESTDYYNYVTSDNILDLVDEDEVVEWIENALDEDASYITDLDEQMKKN